MLLIGRQNMKDWQSTDLGRGALRDLSGFEIEAFFTYSDVKGVSSMTNGERPP